MTTNSNKTSVTHRDSLYKEDFYLWLNTTAQLLRSRQLDDVDFDNLIEEIESMSGSQRRELKNRLIVLLMHLLKYQYQPSLRSNSWISTILEQRRQLEFLLKDSPSLKPYYLEVFSDCYSNAVVDASTETKIPVNTFSELCPFSPEDAIDSSFIISLINHERD
ncbi:MULTISPECIES: DUF29 domain-containing protein [Kamptonema]|uniref:DUF29 domain-containing protein n=1 Tax=Kamptonema TaxID=1501433 RepID=UPI0001DAC198|nr:MULTISPECIES: DUF29 domain-containing protein [Kamptonema]CBN58416.1 conserved hypothetical protein [Kamptonema sp. PCC 6506]